MLSIKRPDPIIILSITITSFLSLCGSLAAEEYKPAGLTAVPFTAVHFTDGFWAPRIEINRQVTVWHDIRKCEETGRIDNFAKAGGLMKGKFKGIYFDDSDVYKVLEGVAYTLSNHPDAKLESKADEIIDKIAAAQQPDGYLMSYYILTGLDKRWSNLRSMHELYCAGHLFEAAVAYYQATNKDKFLKVAIKLANHINSIFGPGKRYGVPGHEEIELALVKLYKQTGDEKYFQLAKFFLDERGDSKHRKLFGQYCQDHLPVREQSEIVGHAVRAMYLYSGVADMAALTGDKGYIQAMSRLWHNLTFKKIYLTGGIGASHQGEAFGGDYYLPNATAYAETCASIGLALWSHRLNLLHADGRYFDVFERVLYNGFLSGVSLDGRKFFYVNPLSSDGVYKFNQGMNQRSEWYGCSCCPTNVVRFMPSVGGYVYAVDGRDIYVNLYASGTGRIKLVDREITLRQDTKYPWQGRIKFTVELKNKSRFRLKLRIPGWARGEAIASDLYYFADDMNSGLADIDLLVNNRRVPVTKLDKGYFTIERQWQNGDTVELNLPMPIRRIKANNKVEADKGKVALQRGPIVYCLEQADNGKGLDRIYLPAESKLTSRYVDDILHGVVVLEGQAMKRSLKEVKFSRVQIVAIPYYSWNNRGAGEMTVWIPEQAKYLPPFLPPTIASLAKVTASHCWDSDSEEAVNDQQSPSSSHDQSIPRFTWWPKTGDKEWIELDFPEPAEVSRVEVYWFDDRPNGGCRVPQSWRLYYRDGLQWKPVSQAGTYPVKLDTFNKVTFAKVKTDGLRIEVQLLQGKSAGILEWRVH